MGCDPNIFSDSVIARCSSEKGRCELVLEIENVCGGVAQRGILSENTPHGKYEKTGREETS